jgi:hypothetical protein
LRLARTRTLADPNGAESCAARIAEALFHRGVPDLAAQADLRRLGLYHYDYV